MKHKKPGNPPADQDNNKQKKNEEFPGYPPYPPGDDAYIHLKKEDDIDPANISEKKEETVEDPDEWNEKSADDLKTGSDLDIPGAELDDANEDIGEEDEENNYYSLGGDNHDD